MPHRNGPGGRAREAANLQGSGNSEAARAQKHSHISRQLQHAGQCQPDRLHHGDNDVRDLEAKDGFVNIAAFGDVMWKRFCDALKADKLFNDPKYQSVKDRSNNHQLIKSDMNKVTSQFSVEELVVLLNEEGVPTGPINNIGEGFEDPQVKYLEIAKPAPHPELGDLNLVRSPINLSRFPQPEKFDSAAPDPGVNSEIVLKDLGIEESQIVQLREQGVIS